MGNLNLMLKPWLKPGLLVLIQLVPFQKPHIDCRACVHAGSAARSGR